MKVVFAGGGTGGHIYPAVAVAKALRLRDENCRILFAGNRNGMEASLIPQEGFEICYISSAGLSSNPIKAVAAIGKLSLGVVQALGLLSKEKPQLVVGSGGYVSAPVTAAAFLKKIPVVLLEQNTVPGKTNRFVSRIAKKVCISFSESAKYVKQGKSVLTGNPVRGEIVSADRAQARERLHIPEDVPCLLVTGASQGAQSINDAMIRFAEKWSNKPWAVIHLTGEKHYDSVKELAAKAVGEGKLLYRCFPYLKNIYDAYAACDLVVCRAGATTLAEITARGIAAIVVPYPYAAENHQEKNGRWLAEQGASLLLLDNVVREELAPLAGALIADSAKIDRMSAISKSIGKPQACSEILKVLDEVMANK